MLQNTGLHIFFHDLWQVAVDSVSNRCRKSTVNGRIGKPCITVPGASNNMQTPPSVGLDTTKCGALNLDKTWEWSLYLIFRIRIRPGTATVQASKILVVAVILIYGNFLLQNVWGLLLWMLLPWGKHCISHPASHSQCSMGQCQSSCLLEKACTWSLRTCCCHSHIGNSCKPETCNGEWNCSM